MDQDCCKIFGTTQEGVIFKTEVQNELKQINASLAQAHNSIVKIHERIKNHKEELLNKISNTVTTDHDIFMRLQLVEERYSVMDNTIKEMSTCVQSIKTGVDKLAKDKAMLFGKLHALSLLAGAVITGGVGFLFYLLKSFI